VTCREFTDFLYDYLCGDLSVDVCAEFESHIAECPECVAYMDSYKKTILLEKTALFADASSPVTDVPEELIQAILSARFRNS
jgi:anti-sigma factor RsiW